MDSSTITLLILAFAVVMFILEKIPLSLTAIMVSLSLTVFGVLTPTQAFAGFVNPSVILFAAMFVVGGAIFETGMAVKIGGLVTRFAKTERQLLVSTMVVAGALSGVLSNTGSAAILIPIITGISLSAGFSPARLLMPMAFAVSLGGTMTLIGSPVNLIGQAGLEQIGLSFGFFEFGMIGVPILVAGIVFFYLFGSKFLPTSQAAAQSATGGSIELANVPRWKRTMALLVLAATLAAMIFEEQIGIPLHVSGAIGAVILVLTRTITEKQAFGAIDMRVIFLFGGVLPLATALEQSGAGAMVANSVISLLGGYQASSFALMSAIFLLSVILTNFISNTATAALLVPIAISIATAMGSDPRAAVMSVVIGSSMAFATPVGTPPNAMVLSAGGYRFIDYVKAGLPLLIIVGIVSLVLLPVLFPFYQS